MRVPARRGGALSRSAHPVTDPDERASQVAECRAGQRFRTLRPLGSVAQRDLCFFERRHLAARSGHRPIPAISHSVCRSGRLVSVVLWRSLVLFTGRSSPCRTALHCYVRGHPIPVSLYRGQRSYSRCLARLYRLFGQPYWPVRQRQDRSNSTPLSPYVPGHARSSIRASGFPSSSICCATLTSTPATAYPPLKPKRYSTTQNKVTAAPNPYEECQRVS